MSHRDDCPSDWEARRQGERDYEYRGYRSYSSPYDCDEASRAYQDGQRSAEYAAEERRAEEAEFIRHQEQYDYEMQAAYEADMRRQYEADMQRQFEADMAAQEKDQQ